MLALLPITPGEVADRLSIQSIRLEKLGTASASPELLEEVDLLRVAWGRACGARTEIGSLLNELESVNNALWELEDELRRHERDGDFGNAFIQRARCVYQINDQRAALKRRINGLCAVRHTEIKTYSGG